MDSTNALKLGADDPYVRAVRTGRTYGPDVRVCIFAPVRTARNYGPYVRVVCTDHPYAPVRPGGTYGPDGKSIVMQCFFQLRVVCTELPYVRAVKTRVLTLSSVIKFTYSLNDH